MKKRRRYDAQFYLFAFLALILAFSYVVSLVVTPATTQQTVDPASIDTTDLTPIGTPRPTPFRFPTAEPDGPVLINGEPVIHTNGLFQVTAPVDFQTRNNDYNPTQPRARITLGSGERVSIVDVLLDTGINYPSHQVLADTLFDQAYFTDAWQEYTGFTEISRVIGDTIRIDFNLETEDHTYLGRQIAWLDQDWLHIVRLIVPDNNPLLLDGLQGMIVPSFVSYADQRGKPGNWVAYRDPEQGFLVRHPYWRIISKSVLETTTGEAQLILRTPQSTAVATLEEAESYVTETLRPGATVLASQVTARAFASGFMISYSDRDNDGNAVSGLVVLLNDVAGQLYVAEIRLEAAGVDLLTMEPNSPYQQLREVLDTFMVLPPDGYTIVPAENPPGNEE